MSDERNEEAVQRCIAAPTAVEAARALTPLLGRSNAVLVARVLRARRRRDTRVEIQADDRFVLHYFHPRPDDHRPGPPHDFERDRQQARRRFKTARP